ncbi:MULTISPECIES: hypothetical protein [unclassified Thiocapsa]|uniref:InlB B-repeat-containing protein n=1 Tax=unclassified Thiocapsa TaxID=2641286 RepID=UPI0035B388DA
MITCLSSAGAAVVRLALLSLLLWSVLLPAAENTAIILDIEEPLAGVVYQGVANLRGWAVAPQGVERIAAYLNGAYVFDIPQGGLREDVAAHPVYGTYPGAATSGFSMALNYGDRPAGQYSLRIRAFDRLGDYRDRGVSFNSIAFPNPYIVHTPEAPEVRLDPNNTVIDALGPSVFAIDGIEIEGEIYDLTLRWRDQLQGFAIESIVPTAAEVFTVSGSVSPAGGGSASWIPASVVFGGSSTCTATANTGYVFIGWSGVCTGTQSSCSLSNITANKTVVASFGPGSASIVGEWNYAGRYSYCTEAARGTFIFYGDVKRVYAYAYGPDDWHHDCLISTYYEEGLGSMPVRPTMVEFESAVQALYDEMYGEGRYQVSVVFFEEERIAVEFFDTDDGSLELLTLMR